MTEEDKVLEETKMTLELPSHVSIVIVEDDSGHYVLTKNCLRGAGIFNEIIWLEDGQAAMNFFWDENFRKDHQKYIILLDIRLPKIDGTVILEKLKKDENFEGIPIIMLTTSEDQQVARECYELGCDAHVVKPPGMVLLKAIERIKMRL